MKIKIISSIISIAHSQESNKALQNIHTRMHHTIFTNISMKSGAFMHKSITNMQQEHLATT